MTRDVREAHRRLQTKRAEYKAAWAKKKLPWRKRDQRKHEMCEKCLRFRKEHGRDGHWTACDRFEGSPKISKHAALSLDLSHVIKRTLESRVQEAK